MSQPLVPALSVAAQLTLILEYLNHRVNMIAATAYASARINLSRIAAILLAVALCITGSRWSRNDSMMGPLLGFTGWLLVASGVIGRIWAGSYICGCKNVRLMQEGPYSVCRNPLYLFSLMGGTGIMLITQTLFFPLLFALVFLSYYQPVMHSEEQTLSRIHGASFEAYRSSVPLFWPHQLHFSEPENYAMSAGKFRRFLIEVVWFIVAAALVQLMETLHGSGSIGTLFWIY